MLKSLKNALSMLGMNASFHNKVLFLLPFVRQCIFAEIKYIKILLAFKNHLIIFGPSYTLKQQAFLYFFTNYLFIYLFIFGFLLMQYKL